MVDEFIALISNVGFPIAVSSYLLIRLEPVVKSLEQSIAGLTIVIANQNEATHEQVNQLAEMIQTDKKRNSQV